LRGAGGSTANLAIILVDARKGIITQTKRHTFLVSLLGIKHIVLAVNKMDLKDYSENVFNNICDDYRKFITRLDIPDVHFIPLSALNGDNVVDLSDKMPWYHGKSLLHFLENVHVGSDRNFDDLRFPVQFVSRPSLDFRGFSGKLASGVVRKGDELMVLPSLKTSRVSCVLNAGDQVDYAFPPQSITICLEDEIDVSRGDMLVHPGSKPRIERQFEAMLVWMDEQPMDPFAQFYIKHAANTTKARIDEVKYRIDVNTHETLYFDPYKNNHTTGSFVLIDTITHNTCAVGMIIDKLAEKDLYSRITAPENRKKIDNGLSLISPAELQGRYRQKGATIWITGLHGSGKNVLAYSVERKLFDLGATVVLLDGSTVRSGLSRELDYSPADRAEHLRRVAHVCRILNDQGIITICSFISPRENIRQQLAEIIGLDRFKMVYMAADLDYCRTNKSDLYKMADEGQLKHMPGVDEVFDIPENPALSLEPKSLEDNCQKLIELLEKESIFPLK